MADNSYDDQYKGFSLKALTLQYGTSEEDMKDLIDAFIIFDKNKSGNIDKNELKDALKMIGLDANDATLNIMMEEMDFNGSGAIEFNEFVTLMRGAKAKKQNDYKN